jgi:translation initiation factor IF-1
MPKNTKGGSGHKGLASKDCYTAKANAKTRISVDEYELYGQVKSMTGNGMFIVFCQDSKFRLCIIRGKFKGKGKRDNVIIAGSWVLVGLREFETEHDVGIIDPGTLSGKQKEKNKLDKCDLLELYSEKDKNYLKSEINLPCWSLFNLDKTGGTGTGGSGTSGFSGGGSNIIFSNESDNSYADIMNMDLTGIAPKKLSLIKKEHDEAEDKEDDDENAAMEINIDDI